MHLTLHFLLIISAAHFICGQMDFAPFTTYNLPSGAELLIGSIKSSFSCDDKKYGYYADIDHNCKIFHICHPTHNSAENEALHQTSFLCPNVTVFDQSTLSCIHKESDNLMPCNRSPQLYYLNENLGNIEN